MWNAAQVLWGECVSGALYITDFMTLAKQVGYADPRQLQVQPPRSPLLSFRHWLYRKGRVLVGALLFLIEVSELCTCSPSSGFLWDGTGENGK